MTSLDKGGIHSNIDLKEVDAAKRYEAEQDERNDQLLTDAKREAREAGPGSGFAVYLPGELESGKTSTAAQRAIRDLHNDEDPRAFPRAAIVAPEAPGGFQWEVDEKLAAQIMEGKRCANCLQLQKRQGSALCEWRDATTDIKGCGFSSLIDDFPR